MSNTKKIIIGTRGSSLALKQTEIVKNKLSQLDPSLNIEVRIIKTEGDINMREIPIDIVGKGWFTKEIEKELINKNIDLAVHSLKDLPEELPSGLLIGAILERDDIRDVLISKNNIKFEDLKPGSIIGTDSIRRKIQVLALRDDLIIRSIRGNVNTRLDKLMNDNYDGLILAAAGLHRLDMKDIITQYFEPRILLPAPGQAALAVEIREGDLRVSEIVSKINDITINIEITAERGFSSSIGGGCKQPVGTYATCKDKKISLYAMLGSLDGSRIVKGHIEGDISEAGKLGKELASQLLERIVIGLI